MGVRARKIFDGFRQDNKNAMSAWRKYNFDALARLGMPSGIVPNYHRFLLAVQNGNDFESGWCSESDMSGEATGLLRLLEEQFDDESWDLIENSKR